MTQRLTLFHFHFADKPNVETRPSLCRSNNRARMSLHPSFSWFSNNWPFFYPSGIVSTCKGFALVSITYPVNKVHLWKIDHSICHASSHSQQLNGGNLAIATLWTNKDATYLITAILVCNNLGENLITKQNFKGLIKKTKKVKSKEEFEAFHNEKWMNKYIYWIQTNEFCLRYDAALKCGVLSS